MEKGFKTWKVPTYIRIEKISQLSAFKAGSLDVTKSNVKCPRRLFWGSCEEQDVTWRVKGLRLVKAATPTPPCKMSWKLSEAIQH